MGGERVESDSSDKRSSSEGSSHLYEHAVGKHEHRSQHGSLHHKRDHAATAHLTEQEHLDAALKESIYQPSKERDHLTTLAKNAIKDPQELKTFQDNIEKLEHRAEKRGMAPEEIAKTYKNVGRLLDEKVQTPWSLPEEQRRVLAEQVISQAATPTSISQGQHETCNVTAVEVRTYSLHPSNASKLVSDVAINGSYKAPGTKSPTVHIYTDSIKYDDESKNNPPKDGERSYATQLFNVTAVNTVQKTDRTGNVYINDPDGGNEKLYNKNKRKIVANDPDLSDDQIVKAYDLINHANRKTDPTVLIDTADNVSGDGKDVTKVNSPQELQQKLLEAKRTGQLPVILGVDSHVEPFWTDSGHGDAGGSQGGHVVTATDITMDKHPKVSIDNQWQASADHFGADAIPLNDIYTAMHEARVASTMVGAGDMPGGTEKDAVKDLEVERLRHFTKSGDLQGHTASEQHEEDRAYAQNLAKIIEEDASGLDTASREKFSKKIETIIDDPNLTPTGRLKVGSLAHAKNLTTNEKYTEELSDTLLQMIDLKDAKRGSSAGEHNDHKYKLEEFKSSEPIMKDTLQGLTSTEREKVFDHVLKNSDYSDRAKMDMLRAMHHLGLVKDTDLAPLVATAMRELKEREKTHEFDGYKGRTRHKRAVEEEKKLLAELPAFTFVKLK